MMSLEKLEDLTARFGGDLSAWPAPERTAAAQLAETDPAAAEILRDAAALDALLKEIGDAPADGPHSPWAAEPSLALQARVLEDAAAASSSLQSGWGGAEADNRLGARSASGSAAAGGSWFGGLADALGLRPDGGLLAGGLGLAAAAGLALGLMTPPQADSALGGMVVAALTAAEEPSAAEENDPIGALFGQGFDDDFDDGFGGGFSL